MAKNESGQVRSGATKQTGGCHCGAVRYEVQIDLSSGVSRCNCSICTKIAPTSGMVKPEAFTLRAGEDALSTYAFGNVSTRYFCKKCGVHAFGKGHLAELGGDFVGINLNTLDSVDPSQLKVIYWDGRHDNWEAGPRDTPWPIAP